MLTTLPTDINNGSDNYSLPIKPYFSYHPENTGLDHGPYNIMSNNKILLKSIEDVNICAKNDSSVNNMSDISSSTMQIHTHKRHRLNPTKFPNACICGHFIEHRDLVYEKRKRINSKLLGITVRPTVPPIKINLRK